MAAKPKRGCAIIVEAIYNRHDEYPLSKNGWTNAYEKSLAHARAGNMALTDLICDGQHIPLYQCSTDQGRVYCAIERVGDGRHPSGDHVLCAPKTKPRQKALLGGARRRQR